MSGLFIIVLCKKTTHLGELKKFWDNRVMLGMMCLVKHLFWWDKFTVLIVALVD